VQPLWVKRLEWGMTRIARKECEFIREDEHEWRCVAHDLLCIGSEPVLCRLGYAELEEVGRAEDDFLHWSHDRDPRHAICGYTFTEWEVKSNDKRSKCPACMRILQTQRV